MLYHRYLREARAQEAQEQVVEAPKAETVSGWTRFGETLGDFSKSVFSGLEKAFEGLLDFGASTVGVIAGWAGNEDLKKSASDWAARDLVEEQWQAARDAGLHPDFENSWINDLSETGQNIVRGVGQGIGQMLPEIALAIATSGASAGVQAGVKAANLAMLGISAAGTATEEALNTDIVDSEGNVTRPSLDRAYLYGLANGAVEIATEKLVGGVFENVTGAGLTDGIISKISKKLAGSGAFAKAVEFGLDAVGEGVEEMVSEAVSNTLKTIYNSEDGKMHWEDPNMQDVLVSGIIGSLTAATLGGGNVAIRNASKTMSIQDSLVDIDNNLKNAERRARNGKLTESDIDTIKASNDQNIEKISRRFQRADAKGREKLMSAFPQLREYLNEDGTVKITELNEGAVEISSKQAAEAMSGSLAVSRRTEIANKLAEKNIKLAENMDETQKENMSLLVKALKLTEGKRGSKMNVVVAEHLDENAHIDGDVMYISKDRLNSKETVAKDFAHEAFHFAEGTKEYGSMSAFMAGLEVDGKSLLDSALDKVKNLGYDVDNKIFDAIKEGKDLTEFEAKQVDTALSEINAKAAEMLLGDPDTIERLIDNDRSLAKKVLNKIKDTIKAIEAYFKGDKETSQTLNLLKTAEKLYTDALANSGQRYAQQRALGEQVEIQEKRDEKYKRKKSYYSQYNTDVLSWAFSSKTKVGDMRVFYDAHTNTWNKLIADNSEEGYGILMFIQDTPENAQQIKNLNKEVYDENYRDEQGTREDLHKDFEEYGRQTRNFGDDLFDDQNEETNGRAGGVVEIESRREGNGDTRQSSRNSEVKKSLREKALPDDVEDKVKAHYGTTYNWRETGYIYKDGTRIDLSGRNDGARGGVRQVDHREVFGIDELENIEAGGSEAMIEFVSRGNIRVLPESPGISLQVEPTAEQYKQIADLVERIGWKEKSFSVDFENENGDNIDSLSYSGNVSAKKVVSDIEYFFKEGKLPYKSDLSNFRYSLREDGDYLEAVQDGNTERAKQLVVKAAEKAGYTEKLYHGTRDFGFTKFDKSKVDDGISFFVTKDKKLAKTYADTDKIKSVSSPKIDTGKLSQSDLIKQLNENADLHGEYRDKYSTFNYQDYERRSDALIKQLDGLKTRVNDEIERYSGILQKDFQLKTDSTLNLLKSLKRALDTGAFKYGDFNNISTPLWCLINQTEVFSDIKSELVESEKDTRILSYFKKTYDATAKSNNLVLKEVLGGYSFEFIAEDEARTELGNLYGKGIYELFGNPGKQLVIEAEGQYWNNIKNWQRAIEPTFDNSIIKKIGDKYVLFDKESDNPLEGGEVEITPSNKELFEKQGEQYVQILLMNKVSNRLRIVTENHRNTRAIARWAKNLGYDSVLIKNVVDFGAFTDLDENGKLEDYTGDIEIYFDPNRLKSADAVTLDKNGKVIPLSQRFQSNEGDIRYSLRDEIRTDDKKARRLLLKRIEGLQLDNRGRYYAVADETMFADDEKGDHLMNQIRLMTDQDEMIRQKYANDLAISIVNNLCVTDVDPQLLDDLTKQAAAVNDYRRKINLSSIKGEINSKYGNKNSIFLQWHNPNGISVDDAIMELRSQGIDVDDNNIADGFFDMLDIVDDAKRATDKVLSKKAKDLLSPDEYDALVDELREDIISFMDEHTSAKEVENYYKNVKREADLIVDNARQKAANIEKLATLEADLERAKASEEFKEKVAELEAEKKRITEEEHIRATNEIADVQTRHILVDKIWGESQAFTADNLKKFKNMSELRDETFEKGVKPLGAIRFRGELKKFGMRKKMVEFAKWYSVENQLLTGGLSEDEIAELKADPNSAFIGYLDKTALEALDYLTSQMMVEGKNGSMIENHKGLTNKELQALRIVLGAARQLLKEYNAIQVHGKTLVLTEEATAANTRATQVSGIVRKKVGVADKAAGLARMMMRPDAVISEMMGGEDNAFSQLYRDIQEGESHAHYIKLELDKMINDFFKDHKSYKKRLSSETVKIGDHEIKLESAISLYMLAQQQHSVDGLEASGWGYRDSKGYWVDCGQFTLQDQLALEKAMTAEDKQFVRTLRRFFHKAAEYQIATDKKYRGYSLIEENGDSDYFPITRYGGDTAKAVQDNDAQNINTVFVANYSISKERVANKHRVDVIPVTRVLEQLSKQVSMYSGLALAIKEFQRLYNCNIGKEGKVISIRNTINEKSWNGFNSYLTDLLQDIQGKPRESGAVNKALNTLRGHYATFQLGFNIKTILSQVAGYPAILPYVHPSSMLKAFTHGLGKGCYNNMISNCEWAAVKCQEGGVVLAETATEKLNAFGKVATAGVEWMDTQLNKMIWNACQCEVERLHKGDPEYRFGTEKNMKAAAELHAEVGRKTQGNSAKSEGTAMQRSSNVIIKGLSMFNSDGFKMVSCLYEGITKARALHELEKQGVKVDPKAKTQAKQYIAKSATSILASTMVYCAVAELMKFALNKDRNKDKEGNEMGVLQDYGMEMLSQLVGMVPVVRDIYSMIVEGFDVDNFATSGFTDLAKSMSEGFQSIIGLAQDEKQTSSDYAAPIKKIIDSLGQITGIPTRNVYNYVYGAVKRFDESAAYKWSDFVYGNSYSKDLTKAMQEGDEKLAGTIIGLMMKNDGMTDTSAKVNDTLRTLHSQGYTVLPKAVGNSFSFDGETYSMSGKQATAFKSIYGKANEEVEELIASAGFSALDGSVQAKSIKWIYDYYYENAIYRIVGEEADTKRQLFGETMDISKFAMTIAACNAVESKLDKKGNVIAGSKKAAVEKLLNRLRLTQSEKLMILAYLGYSVEDSERVIKNYISRLGLSKSQQRTLLKYCGLTA